MKSWEYYEHIEPGRVAVSDGIRIFVFEENQIMFNLEKCAETDKISEILNRTESYEVKPTNTLYWRTGEKLYRSLVPKSGSGEENAVWIEEDFVKRFEKFSFFYGGGATPVSVRDTADKLIAAILPCDIDGSIRNMHKPHRLPSAAAKAGGGWDLERR